MGLFWGLRSRNRNHKTKPSRISQLVNFLETEIDLTAPVPDFKKPVSELVASALTKYFCSQCAKRIDYETNEHYETYCKYCYNQLFPDKPKKKLYRKNQTK